MKHSSIGVFDSGVGGLTVVSAIKKMLPQESIVYVGDTARVPYGNRNDETIREYASEITKFLLKRDVKMLVIACNTMSAVAYETIRELTELPVIDVIRPTVDYVVSQHPKSIGIFGTKATVKSGLYAKLISNVIPQAFVQTYATPLLVPLIEEGMHHHQITKSIINYYYTDMTDKNIDHLILGCTHYPMIKREIESVVGSGVTVVDSAIPTAKCVRSYLEKHELSVERKPTYELLFTDLSEHVISVVHHMFDDKEDSTISHVTV